MASRFVNPSSKLLNFVGSLPVLTLPELLTADSIGVSVVGVWFDSVVEGVDMWFSEDQSAVQPRFRMKMKVTHGDHVAVFFVFDEEVQKLAMETCPLMLSMGESCSLYPDEMECFYSDGYLCKVEKRCDVDFDEIPSFKVVSLCNDVGVFDLFSDGYLARPRTFFDVNHSSTGIGGFGVPFGCFSSPEHHQNHDDCVVPDLSSKNVVKENKKIEVPFVGSSSLQTKDDLGEAVVPVISPVYAYGQFSPEINVNGHSQEVTPTPSPAFFVRKNKVFKKRSGKCVGTLVYSRRKTATRRKLCFDDVSESVVKKIGGSNCHVIPKN
ncbi:hypothetical protein TSUD_104920 [Trifolium subterraneum]|uniref:Uncharacterized protein n=1 Tax=Trifolium subterraneum TaxID=3900 RepID=A0A2Z6NGW8_TRISU|nr:hypothetical protein TSUD_104920 [Trifolium subterraneum]